jgi:hypothetical protein
MWAKCLGMYTKPRKHCFDIVLEFSEASATKQTKRKHTSGHAPHQVLMRSNPISDLLHPDLALWFLETPKIYK